MTARLLTVALVAGALAWTTALIARSADTAPSPDPAPSVAATASDAPERPRSDRLRPGTPEEAGMHPATTARIDAVMDWAIDTGAFPGAALVVGRGGVLVERRGFGRLTPGGPRATPSTPYDLASLTKVVGTTTALMRLVERGQVDLDAPVRRYLPSFDPVGQTRPVRVRHLLEHTAGQRPWMPFYALGILDRDAALAWIHRDTLRTRPGATVRYSDFDMILLGEIVERVTGLSLDRAVAMLVTEPLGMDATRFRATGTVDASAAPTETDTYWRMRTLRGEVHDEAASVMGGVAGHAGLFSTADDLARFAYLYTQRGRAYGVRLFRPATLRRFTRRIPARGDYDMALGWMRVPRGRDLRHAAGVAVGPQTYGHTGYTGTSIWIDPETELFIVLLTNRVHPSRANNRIRDVRARLHTAIAASVVPGSEAP